MLARIVIALATTLLFSACTRTQPLRTVDYVDLERFMGDWYVIANIPTFVEQGAHNAVESYRLDANGTIATRFTFRQDGFDGAHQEYNPRGFVQDHETNAVWGMQFIWPFKAEYRIVYLNQDYTQTVIGRSQRDYVWIMARTPHINEADLDARLVLLATEGYDIERIKRVPQSW